MKYINYYNILLKRTQQPFKFEKDIKEKPIIDNNLKSYKIETDSADGLFSFHDDEGQSNYQNEEITLNSSISNNFTEVSGTAFSNNYSPNTFNENVEKCSSFGKII